MMGRLRARRGGKTVSSFGIRPVAVLLAYLVLHPDQTQSREDLINLLYEEGAVKDREAAFRNTLWMLRRILEPPDVPSHAVICSDRHSVRLQPGTTASDVADWRAARFRSASAYGSQEELALLLQCTELYRGEFMTGHNGPWIVAKRIEFAEDFRQTLERISEIYEEHGDPDKAIAVARRIVSVEPTFEPAHACIIRLSNPAQALRQYRLLEEILRRELNIEPSREIRLLAAQARHSKSATRKQLKSMLEDPSRAIPATSENRFPFVATRFFGRQTEIEEVESLLRNPSNRVISLVGPGGCGKTRLSIEIGRRVKKEVAFVPLADISRASLIPDLILRSLGKQPSPDSDWILKLQEIVSPLVLILDNLEHLLVEEDGPIVSEIITDMLQRCPNAQCLLTSRQSLGLRGERQVLVQPLPVPNSMGVSGTAIRPQPDLAELLTYPSVQMYLDRAQATVPYFQATERNATDIASLCQRLEGIPLAIELAAAWVRTLTPAEMLKQISNRYDLLRNKKQWAEERHQTLRATLDYSYVLLSEPQQDLMKHLSVFQGGCSLESIVAICDQEDLLDTLAELIDRSLLFTIENPEGTRYSMLETLREYAWEKMDPDEQAAVSQRHFATYLALAENFGGNPSHLDSKLTEADLEQGNLMAALEWSFREAKYGEALRLTVALSKYWDIRRQLVRAKEWLVRLLPLVEDTIDPIRAEALQALGHVHFQLGEYEKAEETMTLSLEAEVALGDDHGTAKASHLLGYTMMWRGKSDRARELMKQALELGERLGDHDAVADGHRTLAALELSQNKREAAFEHLQQYLSMKRQSEDNWGTIAALNNLAVACLSYEMMAEARQAVEECLHLQVRLGGQRRAATLLTASQVKMYYREFSDVRDLLFECLQNLTDTAEMIILGTCLVRWAQLEVEVGAHKRVPVFLGAAQAIFDANSKTPLLAGVFVNMEECRKQVAKHLTAAEMADLHAIGASASTEDILTLAGDRSNIPKT